MAFRVAWGVEEVEAAVAVEVVGREAADLELGGAEVDFDVGPVLEDAVQDRCVGVGGIAWFERR